MILSKNSVEKVKCDDERSDQYHESDIDKRLIY